MFKVYFASDHGGFELKNNLVLYVKELGYEAIDKGAFEFDPDDDYPKIIAEAAKEVSKSPYAMGIILGGSGQGEAIVANRFKGIRAAVFYGPVNSKAAVDIAGTVSDNAFEIVKLARTHNNANILSLGSRFISENDAKQAVKIFLETEFSKDERHERRIKKIDEVN